MLQYEFECLHLNWASSPKNLKALSERRYKKAGKEGGGKKERAKVEIQLGVGREAVKKGTRHCLVQLQLCHGIRWDPQTCK